MKCVILPHCYLMHLKVDESFTESSCATKSAEEANRHAPHSSQDEKEHWHVEFQREAY